MALCGEVPEWKPRCRIILHQTDAEYLRTVGQGGASTLGSSLVSPAAGHIRTRRIDLKTNIGNFLTAALPHELCHVVVADRFRIRPAPLWFDEGIALQYDPENKLRLHERDFQRGLEQGGLIPLATLLDLIEYPPPSRLGVFYGQSAALVKHLLTRGTGKQLLECVESAPVGEMATTLETNYAVKFETDFFQSLPSTSSRRLLITTVDQ